MQHLLDRQGSPISLKRKLAEDDAEQSASSRPQKRNKTPPEQGLACLAEHIELEEERNMSDCAPVVKEEPSVVSTRLENISEDQPTEQQQDAVTTPLVEDANLDSNLAGVLSNPNASLPRDSALRSSLAAFAAFANTKTSFHCAKETCTTDRQIPIWRQVSFPRQEISDNSPVTGRDATKMGATTLDHESGSSLAVTKKKLSAIEDRAEFSIPVSHKLNSVEILTGEENEVVNCEMKGVKLFIKRGDREFTDAIYGHIKILSHNMTLEDRLLFRREPIGQVTVNVRLRPTIRCSYDPEENILRLVLKEDVKQDGACVDQVVIYAFKPGRALKPDFGAFAAVLTANSHLKDDLGSPS